MKPAATEVLGSQNIDRNARQSGARPQQLSHFPFFVKRESQSSREEHSDRPNQGRAEMGPGQVLPAFQDRRASAPNQGVPAKSSRLWACRGPYSKVSTARILRNSNPGVIFLLDIRLHLDYDARRSTQAENPLPPHRPVLPSEPPVRPFAHRLASVLALVGLLVWNIAGWVHPFLHHHGHGNVSPYGKVDGDSRGQWQAVGATSAVSGTDQRATATVANDLETPASSIHSTNCCCTASHAATRASVAAAASAEPHGDSEPVLYAATPGSECSHLTCALCKLTKSTHALVVFTTDFVAALQLAATPVCSDLQLWCPPITTSARGPPTR